MQNAAVIHEISSITARFVNKNIRKETRKRQRRQAQRKARRRRWETCFKEERASRSEQVNRRGVPHGSTEPCTAWRGVVRRGVAISVPRCTSRESRTDRTATKPRRVLRLSPAARIWTYSIRAALMLSAIRDVHYNILNIINVLIFYLLKVSITHTHIDKY